MIIRIRDIHPPTPVPNPDRNFSDGAALSLSLSIGTSNVGGVCSDLTVVDRHSGRHAPIIYDERDLRRGNCLQRSAVRFLEILGLDAEDAMTSLSPKRVELPRQAGNRLPPKLAEKQYHSCSKQEP